MQIEKDNFLNKVPLDKNIIRPSVLRRLLPKNFKTQEDTEFKGSEKVLFVSQIHHEQKNIPSQKSHKLFSLVESLRPHHWSKNILVFLPLLLSHQWQNMETWPKLIMAFMSFSMLASSVYLFNDLIDLENDRAHPVKKSRPFARGDLSPFLGILCSLILMAFSFALGLELSLNFTYILVMYLSLNIVYSLYFKKTLLLDVIILASLYTLRLVAGGVVARVALSPWLKAFALFFFLGLALLKRYSEVQRLIAENRDKAKVRAYGAQDAPVLSILGIGLGLISALVLAFYIYQPQTADLYSHAENLWGICILLIYWIGRLWMLAFRGGVTEDPVVFALKDKVSYSCALLSFVIVMLSL